jgi:glutamine amidotransferase
VHSYIVEPDDAGDIAGITSYGVTFPSIVSRDHIWGTQFHPEKSGDLGIALVGEWLETVTRRQAA